MKKKIDWSDVGARVLAGGIVLVSILAILAVVLGIRLWITGGDFGCIWAQDPALCVAVKSVGGQP